MDLELMKKKRDELLAKIADLQASDKPEALDELVNVVDEAEKLDGQIAAKEKAEALSARLKGPAPVPALRRHEGPRPAAKPAGEPGSGLLNLNDPRLDRIIAAMPYGGARLHAAAGDLFRESQGPDGGFMLPVDKKALQRLLAPPQMIHTLCDLLPTQSNAVDVPVDEDPVWSTDLAAVDINEGDDMEEDKVAVKTVSAMLRKSYVYTRVTSEMLEDNTGIGEYLVSKIGEKLSWRLHARCISAMLNSPAKVAVTETNAGGTLPPSITDVISAWGRMLGSMRTGAVWIANPALEASMMTWTIGQVPVYIAPGGVADAPFGRLFGRPVFFVEGLPAVGTEGDIALCAPSAFWMLMKNAGQRIESSIHAEFKKDVVVYRGLVRSKCVSKFSAPITRPDATTAGNVVTITTRT
jgi:HK97 family phage major capsid protein